MHVTLQQINEVAGQASGRTPLRRVLVSGGLATGGPQTHVPLLCAVLRAAGAEVAIASASTNWDAPALDELRAQGVRVIVSPFGFGPLQRLGKLWAFLAWPFLLRRDFDTICCIGEGRMHFWAARFARAGGFRIYHEIVQCPPPGSNVARLLPRMDGVVANSRKVAQEIRALSPGVPVRSIPFFTAPAPVPAPAPRPPRREGELLRIAYLGRLAPHKRPLELIDSFAACRQRAPLAPARLDLYGGDHDDEAARLRARIAELGLEESVCLRGPYAPSELDRIFAETDLVVLPSRYEGLPLVLVEAMQRGVPVAATSAGGTAELGEDNPDVIISPGVDWPGFENAMITLAGRIRAGQVDAGRLHAWTEARYGFEPVAAAWREALLQPQSFFGVPAPQEARPMKDFDPMWIWWALTVLICLWKLFEAAILRPAKMLEWPFLACAMWIYFYGVMAYQAKLNLSAYLTKGMDNIGQLMPLLCLIGLLAGWSVGKGVPMQRTRRVAEPPYLLCWFAGYFFLLLGAAGNYSVVHSMQEGTAALSTASAYWYLLFYVGYPGLALAVWAGIKIKSPYRYLLWALNGIGLIAFMFPQVVNARRGPLFPAIIVMLLVPALTLRKAPSRWLFCGTLALAGFVMLLFVQARSSIYNGGTWGDAFQNLDVSGAVVERGEEPWDNEYVINCQFIGTLFQNGGCDYGSGHFGLLLHWVPRAVWPDKPGLGNGSYNIGKVTDDMEEATGVRLLGTGASCAGVADSFLEYGTFCPVFWFILSAGMGLVYGKVLYTRSPWWMFSYVGILCASHWLVSQSFSAAFVPAMYFQIVPIIVRAGLWLHQKCFPPRIAIRHRPRPSSPMPTPQPLAP